MNNTKREVRRRVGSEVKCEDRRGRGSSSKTLVLLSSPTEVLLFAKPRWNGVSTWKPCEVPRSETYSSALSSMTSEGSDFDARVRVTIRVRPSAQCGGWNLNGFKYIRFNCHHCFCVTSFKTLTNRKEPTSMSCHLVTNVTPPLGRDWQLVDPSHSSASCVCMTDTTSLHSHFWNGETNSKPSVRRLCFQRDDVMVCFITKGHSPSCKPPALPLPIPPNCN